MLWSLLSGIFLGTAVTLIAVASILAYSAHGTVLAAIQAAGPVAVGFSAIVAFRVYRANVARHESEDKRNASETYLNEAIHLLERALETFTRSGDNPPKNDRLLWLSTARMILRFNKMKAQITENDHLAIAEENEEYIRLKFYTVLDSNREKFDLNYFMPDGRPYSGNVVARKSVAVIFDFAHWRKGAKDPMDEVDDKELFAHGVVPIDFFGVEDFLSQYQKYWEEIEARKEQYREQIASDSIEK